MGYVIHLCRGPPAETLDNMSTSAPLSLTDRPIRIRELRTYALRTTFSRLQRSSKGDRTFSEMLMVEVVTDEA